MYPSLAIRLSDLELAKKGYSGFGYLLQRATLLRHTGAYNGSWRQSYNRESGDDLPDNFAIFMAQGATLALIDEGLMEYERGSGLVRWVNGKPLEIGEPLFHLANKYSGNRIETYLPDAGHNEVHG
jgi:hypothetical protein